MIQPSNQTILIVDDTPTNLEILSNALMSEGYQVAVAVDGESAISQIQYKPPTLVLLDVMMPGIDGFETCRRLKANAQTKDIPILFMTALSETENKSKGFKLGAVDYITKPFETEEVLVRVDTHLRLYQLTTGLEQVVKTRTAQLTTTLDHLQKTQTKLIRSEKMSLVGELSAGVAYEISNPVNFIHGNLHHVDTYLTQLLQFAEHYYSQQQPLTTTTQSHLPQPLETDFDLDLKFIRKDLPDILGSFHRGTNRIQKLVSALQIFSDPSRATQKSVDVHDLIESCLTLLSHRLQKKSRQSRPEVFKEYQQLPLIDCYPAALSQALMSIFLTYISNIEKAQQESSELTPKILIRTTSQDQQSITITIAVNLKQIIDDSFLTEKSPQLISTDEQFRKLASANDMNLLLAHDIVANQHHGCLHKQTQAGQTELTIELPQCLPVELSATARPAIE